MGEKGLPFFKVGKEMQMEIDSFLKATGMSFLYGCKISNKRQSEVVQRKNMNIFEALNQFWIDA